MKGEWWQEDDELVDPPVALFAAAGVMSVAVATAPPHPTSLADFARLRRSM